MTILRPDIGLTYSLLTAKCIHLCLLIDYSTYFKDVIQYYYWADLATERERHYPGYQRFFSPAAGIFGVGRRPKPRAVRAGHYKDLTETGNRARKVSGTQGRMSLDDGKARGKD